MAPLLLVIFARTSARPTGSSGAERYTIFQRVRKSPQ
jgi:hypothetical protein